MNTVVGVVAGVAGGEGLAEDGRIVQVCVANWMSSMAMSPCQPLPRIPSNTTQNFVLN